jgi:hypothetical protein
VAAVAPDLAVEDQVGMAGRVNGGAALGAVHGRCRLASPGNGVSQAAPAAQGSPGLPATG